MTTWEHKYQKLLESSNKLMLEPLSYGLEDLAPSLSRENVNFHYNKLARGYVDRYNAEEGDADFNEAGAFLHNILFAQFKSPSGANKPRDNMLKFIEQHHGSYEEFQQNMETAAMAIQGSGWVYLAKNGDIKTIANHQIKRDIVLLIDWWEHAWYTDYGPDKKAYLKNVWKIVDWNRITLKLS